MRKRSSTKVKQVMDLMDVLHLKIEAKQHINNQGFIENTIFWIDDEKYPEPEKTAEKEPAQTNEEKAPEAPKADEEVTAPQDAEKAA